MVEHTHQINKLIVLFPFKNVPLPVYNTGLDLYIMHSLIHSGLHLIGWIFPDTSFFFKLLII